MISEFGQLLNESEKSSAPGRKFERYIVNYFVESGAYDIERQPREWTKHKSKEDNEPDCRFKDKASGKRFWVECKWRVNWKILHGKKIVFFRKDSINYYKEIQQQTKYKTFIALGIGKSNLFGETLKILNPKELYFFPIDYVIKTEGNYYYIPQSFLLQRNRMHLFKYKKPKFCICNNLQQGGNLLGQANQT